MTESIRRHPLVTFFLLVFIITWVVWVPRASGAPLGAAGQAWTWAPAIAALLAAALTGGRGALRELGARLVRRLAMVSSGHTRTCCLLACGSGDLYAIWRFLGSRCTSGTPSGALAISAPFLADTDPHRWSGRGACLEGVCATAAAHPLQRPHCQLVPWCELGAVAPSPALDGGKRHVSPARLAAPLGRNGEGGSLHLGFPAHPRKRSNCHAVSRGDQPVHRLARRG